MCRSARPAHSPQYPWRRVAFRPPICAVVQRHASARRDARPKKCSAATSVGAQFISICRKATACASTWSNVSGTALTMMRWLRHYAKIGPNAVLRRLGKTPGAGEIFHEIGGLDNAFDGFGHPGFRGNRLHRALPDVSGRRMNDPIAVWHSLSTGTSNRVGHSSF